MCGAKVGCVVYEGYAFFIKNVHVYLVMKSCQFRLGGVFDNRYTKT